MAAGQPGPAGSLLLVATRGVPGERAALPRLGLALQTLPPKVLPSARLLCEAELWLGTAITEEAPCSSPGCPKRTGSAALPQPKKHFSVALSQWEGWYPTDTSLSLSCCPRHRQVHGERGPVFLPVTLGHPECQCGDGGLCDRCFHRGKSLELVWVGVSLCLLPQLFTWGKQDHVSRKHANLCKSKYISARLALGSPSSSVLAAAVLSSFSEVVRLTRHAVLHWQPWQPGAEGVLQPWVQAQLSQALTPARPLHVAHT